jgi:hypothetical protein
VANLHRQKNAEVCVNEHVQRSNVDCNHASGWDSLSLSWHVTAEIPSGVRPSVGGKISAHLNLRSCADRRGTD